MGSSWAMGRPRRARWETSVRRPPALPAGGMVLTAIVAAVLAGSITAAFIQASANSRNDRLRAQVRSQQALVQQSAAATQSAAADIARRQGELAARSAQLDDRQRQLDLRQAALASPSPTSNAARASSSTRVPSSPGGSRPAASPPAASRPAGGSHPPAGVTTGTTPRGTAAGVARGSVAGGTTLARTGSPLATQCAVGLLAYSLGCWLLVVARPRQPQPGSRLAGAPLDGS